MSDTPEDPAESPIERALRLKKAAQAAKPQAPGPGFKPKAAARMPAGASKPWMKK